MSRRFYEFHRPGPPALIPGQSPGGLVIHVYSRTGQLLLERKLSADLDEGAKAVADVEEVGRRLNPDADVCLVAYDGDTGIRWTTADWTAFASPPGET